MMDGVLEEAQVRLVTLESSWEVQSFSSQDLGEFQSESDECTDEESGDEVRNERFRKHCALSR